MTGTSLDGLDVALVKIVGRGLQMQAQLLGHHAMSIPGELRQSLASLAAGEPSEPISYLRAARALGELHADGIDAMLTRGLTTPIASTNKPPQLEFVVAHGQTIWHAPHDDAAALGGGPKSCQLFDPWPIVNRLEVPVCHDLRQADLIAGGEGAPLTPIADWIIYRQHADAVANLGGVLNITELASDPSQVQGKDLYPCNLMLDGLCTRYFGKPYDDGGDLAASGRVVGDCVLQLDAAISSVCKGRRSLGREQFSKDWLDGIVAMIGDAYRPIDVLHTAARLVAVQLGGTFREPGQARRRLVLAGGGVKNQTLVKLIEDQSFYSVQRSDDIGIPTEAREAMAFAVLGALSQDGIPISLPQVTGATDPGVAGTWSGL